MSASYGVDVHSDLNIHSFHLTIMYHLRISVQFTSLAPISCIKFRSIVLFLFTDQIECASDHMFA